MLTFAFNQMVYYISYQLKDITGGEDGMAGIIRPPLEIPGLLTLKFNTPMNFYILAAVIFFICFWIMYRVVESPFGKIMVATRDNPVRSASIGYHVKRAQILMFTISGIFTGVAGVIFGMHYWIMPIDSIHWLNSGFIVFMVLIGGTTSPFGPVLGTTIFIALQDLFGMIWERWPLLLGLVLVCIVLFLHGGVLEIINRVTTAIQRRKQAEGFVPTNGS
jgi:branched-chain amino acid transport system permease protein